MGFERGAVWVPGRIRRRLVTFLHEQVFAFEFQLGVGGTLEGLGVGLAEYVLGGDWKWAEPIAAQEEEHGLREGVEGDVGPVFRERSWVDPGERQTTARISCT